MDGIKFCIHAIYIKFIYIRFERTSREFRGNEQSFRIWYVGVDFFTKTRVSTWYLLSDRFIDFDF